MTEVYKRKVYFCGQNCIQSFRTTRINQQFKKLPIQNFYSTAAKNSGPIALLYRKFYSKQLKLPDNYQSSLLFFNCKGDMLRTIPFELKERVILFQFIIDEQLLIIYANGNYFIVDPATSNITQGSIFPQEQSKAQTKNRCFGAQMVGEKIIILRQRVIGVVEKLGSTWKPCQAIKINLDNPIFSAYLNHQGQLQIIYINASGSLELLNYSKSQQNSPTTQIYTNPVLKSNIVKLISIVKNEDRLAFIFTDRAILSKINSGTLVFPFNQFTIQKEDPVSKSQTKSKYRNFYQIGFIDNTLYFYDRVRLLFLSLTEPKYEIRHLSMTSLLSQSSIGLRLLDEHTFIFRLIHNAIYFNLVGEAEIGDKILKLSSQQQIKQYAHYKQLATIYEQFVQKKPIDILALKQKEIYVGEVWNLIIKIASMYIDAGQQLMALKFANFIQNYFRFNNKNTSMDNLTKQLRVVNNLRHQYMNRWITYDQFVMLKASDKFLLLLLRYNMHFVTDMIYEDSKSKQKIFSHWARCKIEKQIEATALQQIKARYQQMKVAIGPTYVFTDLARYCLDNKKRNLVNLALQLIELEPHPARRCVVFLFIFLNKKNPQTVDKLLQYAQQSNNTATIHQTIQSLRKISQDWLPPKAWLQILPKKPILQYHYIKILKSNNELQQLKQYLTMNGLFVQMSYISLSKQLQKLQNAPLQEVTELISKKYGKILTSLSDQLEKCNRRSGVDILRELKNKKYPITQEDANALTKDGEFEVLAQMIIKKDGNLPLAARILRKMKSDKVYSLLVRKGKIKDAIQQAFARKNKQKMLELIPMADESMQQLAKQLYQQLIKPR